MRVLFKLFRLLACLVDLFVGVALLVLSLMYIQPFVQRFVGNAYVAAALALICWLGLLLGIQWPFLSNQQTIGKAFFGMKVASTDATRPITIPLMITREAVKVMSLYLICLPLFWSDQGGHDEAMKTEVVRPSRNVCPLS